MKMEVKYTSEVAGSQLAAAEGTTCVGQSCDCPRGGELDSARESSAAAEEQPLVEQADTRTDHELSHDFLWLTARELSAVSGSLSGGSTDGDLVMGLAMSRVVEEYRLFREYATAGDVSGGCTGRAPCKWWGSWWSKLWSSEHRWSIIRAIVGCITFVADVLSDMILIIKYALEQQYMNTGSTLVILLISAVIVGVAFRRRMWWYVPSPWVRWPVLVCNMGPLAPDVLRIRRMWRGGDSGEEEDDLSEDAFGSRWLEVLTEGVPQLSLQAAIVLGSYQSRGLQWNTELFLQLVSMGTSYLGILTTGLRVFRAKGLPWPLAIGIVIFYNIPLCGLVLLLTLVVSAGIPAWVMVAVLETIVLQVACVFFLLSMGCWDFFSR